MKMKNRLLLLPLAWAALLLGAACCHAARADELVVAIIGDSTVADYAPDSPMRGWGQQLPGFFGPPVAVFNAAINGRSTKNYPRDKWEGLLARKPAFVLIQFGHNDSHPKNQPESTDAATDYKEYLGHYIAEARGAGVQPVLVTPPHRRTFDAAGHPTMELEPYAQAMREVARETSVPLIDLYQKSGALLDTLGEAGSASFTIHRPDTADRRGLDDRTHFTEAGATAMARLVAQEAGAVDPRLQAALRLPPPSP